MQDCSCISCGVVGGHFLGQLQDLRSSPEGYYAPCCTLRQRTLRYLSRPKSQTRVALNSRTSCFAFHLLKLHPLPWSRPLRLRFPLHLHLHLPPPLRPQHTLPAPHNPPLPIAVHDEHRQAVPLPLRPGMPRCVPLGLELSRFYVRFRPGGHILAPTRRTYATYR